MYEQNGMHGGGFPEAEDAFSQSYPPENDVAALEIEMEMELQLHQLEIQEMVHEASNWQQMSAASAADFHQIFAAKASLADAAPDLLNIFPHNSLAFYEPLNQPPLLRELFQPFPHQNGDDVFEFTAEEMGTKQVSSEKHRRVVLKDKYDALRALLPTPTKVDRASIVADAIHYIHELKRTVSELKGLVERKRCARERLKRPKLEEEEEEDPYDGSSLRSSWLLRKTKNTEVDVRIVDDEITVKLVQQKRINCLLFVSKVLDDLHLDLHHVAGGLIGDYYSYLFNSKISQGSIVYASAVANKLIQVVDKQYAATTTY